MSAMNVGTTIRPATVADARSIALVHVEGWQAAYRSLLPGEFLGGLSIDQREALWSRIFSEPPSPASRVVVATNGTGHVVGFASVGSSRDEDASTLGELTALYLLPSHWDRGVGRELHDAAMATLAVGGFPGALLWVLRDNARGRAFYERRGWKPDGRAKHVSIGGTPYVEVRYRIGFVGVA